MLWELCHAIRWGHTTCSYCSAVLDICYFDVGGVYIGQKVDMATEKRNRRLPVQATPPLHPHLPFLPRHRPPAPACRQSRTSCAATAGSDDVQRICCSIFHFHQFLGSTQTDAIGETWWRPWKPPAPTHTNTRPKFMCFTLDILRFITRATIEVIYCKRIKIYMP